MTSMARVVREPCAHDREARWNAVELEETLVRAAGLLASRRNSAAIRMAAELPETRIIGNIRGTQSSDRFDDHLRSCVFGGPPGVAGPSRGESSGQKEKAHPIMTAGVSQASCQSARPRESGPAMAGPRKGCAAVRRAAVLTPGWWSGGPFGGVRRHECCSPVAHGPHRLRDGFLRGIGAPSSRRPPRSASCSGLPLELFHVFDLPFSRMCWTR